MSWLLVLMFDCYRNKYCL